MNKDDLYRFVLGMPEDLQTIFHTAYNFIRESDDTLDDSFQIAAAVVALFLKYAQRDKQ